MDVAANFNQSGSQGFCQVFDPGEHAFGVSGRGGVFIHNKELILPRTLANLKAPVFTDSQKRYRRHWSRKLQLTPGSGQGNARVETHCQNLEINFDRAMKVVPQSSRQISCQSFRPNLAMSEVAKPWSSRWRWPIALSALMLSLSLTPPALAQAQQLRTLTVTGRGGGNCPNYTGPGAARGGGSGKNSPGSAAAGCPTVRCCSGPVAIAECRETGNHRDQPQPQLQLYQQPATTNRLQRQ